MESNKISKRKRKFTWDVWDYALDGSAYIIAKSECPNREDVPEYIVTNDNLSLEILDGNNPLHTSLDEVKEGWCKYQVRTDWENGDGEPQGGYYVIDGANPTETRYCSGEKIGKRKPGWFPVWIVRIGEWY